MKKSRLTKTKIVAILKEADAGMKVGKLCRKHSISDATYEVRQNGSVWPETGSAAAGGKREVQADVCGAGA